MILSTLGFIYGGNTDTNTLKYELNNRTYLFGKQYNVYYLNIDNQKVFFYNLPDEINFNLDTQLAGRIKDSRMMYLTFDPEEKDLNYIDLVRFSLTDDLAKFEIFLVSGVTKETKLYELPVIDCVNATEYTPVIKFENSNTTEIDLNENCIIMKGKGLDFIKFRDLLLYKLYGVF